MTSIKDEFEYRVSVLQKLTMDQASSRLSGFYEWMSSQDEIISLIDTTILNSGARFILGDSSKGKPPAVKNPEQVAGVGLLLLQEINNGEDPFKLSHKYGVRPGFATDSLQDYLNALLEKFINPAITHIYRQLPNDNSLSIAQLQSPSPLIPLEITESIKKFMNDNPDPGRTAFIMMQFGRTQAHADIVSSIKSTFQKYGIKALRADDKEYHDDLFPNVQTYMHGCAFGVAVFERLEADDFNPNVSLEVGYMRGIGKRVCLLKDKTLKTLQTDLVGKLYKSFDPQDSIGTIPAELDKWIQDKVLTS